MNPGEILQLLGEGSGAVDDLAVSKVDQAIEACQRAMHPSAVYVLLEADEAMSNEEISLGGLHFQTGRIVQGLLKHSEYYAPFLVTIGPRPEALARKLLEHGEYLEGYITDLVASAMVDALADVAQEEIKGAAFSRGLKITNRYSPGYCLQAILRKHLWNYPFRFFPYEPCKVHQRHHRSWNTREVQ